MKRVEISLKFFIFLKFFGISWQLVTHTIEYMGYHSMKSIPRFKRWYTSLCMWFQKIRYTWRDVILDGLEISDSKTLPLIFWFHIAPYLSEIHSANFYKNRWFLSLLKNFCSKSWYFYEYYFHLFQPIHNTHQKGRLMFGTHPSELFPEAPTLIMVTPKG